MSDPADDPGQAPPTAPGTDPRPDPPTASILILKAMSHPVRQELMRALGRRGHARAADLADMLGLPANQISFHLRTLADAGLIEEAPELARDRRDRVWKPRDRPWQLGTPEHPVADEALGGIVTQGAVADINSAMQRLAAWVPEYVTGRTTEVHGSLTRMRLRLTEAEFLEFSERFDGLVDEFRDLPQGRGSGRRRWEIGFIAVDDEI